MIMGIAKPIVSGIVVVVLAISLIVVVPLVGAEKTTRNYTVPNETFFGPGIVNDTFDLKAGDEVTISWEADSSTEHFYISSSEFMDVSGSGASNWNDTYFIDNDCIVFVEWWNSRNVPIQIELTIETDTPSIIDDPLSYLPQILILSILILVIIVAIGLSRKKRSDLTRIEVDEALEVESTRIPESRDIISPRSNDEHIIRCKHCGMDNPSDAEFCQGCNKPTEMFRKGIG